MTVPAPSETPDLLGQGAAEEVLLQAYRSGRLPHAWLLTGPRGVGKATLAYRFARFLLADSAAAADAGADLFGAPAPADDGLAIAAGSPVFRRVAQGAHPDLRLLARSPHPKTGKLRGEIVVDDVRATEGFLRRTSAEGGWRIVICDPADDLNASAANALLKVLEEPPARAVLLLISHTPDRLLPTIRSRCCRLPLTPLAADTVVALLGRLAPETEPADRAALARLSEGSIGRALDLAAGGLEIYRELIELMAGLPRLDVQRAYALGDRMSARGAGQETFRTGMELLGWWLARMIRGGAEGRLPDEAMPGETALMSRLLAGASLEQWLTLWEKITRLGAEADRINLDRRQVVVTALLEFEALAA